jgi:hypothetical protein
VHGAACDVRVTYVCGRMTSAYAVHVIATYNVLQIEDLVCFVYACFLARLDRQQLMIQVIGACMRVCLTCINTVVACAACARGSGASLAVGNGRGVWLVHDRVRVCVHAMWW